MKETENWLKLFFTAGQDHRENLLALEQISTNLRRVGMVQLGEDLSHIVTQLQEAHEQMRSAVSNKIDNDLKEAKDLSGALLKSILDGNMEEAVKQFREIMAEDRK
jgi:flagellar motor component MotA